MPDSTTAHPNHRDKIGFVGLGNMGSHMSANLAAYLQSNGCPPITLFTRTTSKLPPVSESIAHAASLHEMALECDIVITSLASDEAVNSVYKELFEGAREKVEKRGKGTIFVESSTIYPTTAGDLEREASKIPKTHYLQTPVFGPPPVAESAKLVWVLSGDYFAKRRVQPFLVPAMGRKVIDVGSDVERAAAFKLNGNSLILGIVELLAESMTLADKTGVGADLLMEFITEFLPAPSFIGYGNKIRGNQFSGDTGFTITGGLKDANHIRHLAASVEATCPIIDLAHCNLITSKAHGGGALDWSSLVAGPRLATGLQPFTGLKATPHDTGFGSKRDDGDVEEPQKVGGIKEVRNF